MTGKILFVGTEDWAFFQHRLPMARALKDAGYDVCVVARENQSRPHIEAEGFRFIPWTIRRGSLNPFKELFALFDLMAIVRREKPALIINVALKPIIYGAISAWWVGNVRTISLFAGLGVIFVNPKGALKMVRALVIPFMRFFLGRAFNWMVVQNSDNQAALQNLRIGRIDRFVRIPGSGVDLDDFPQLPEPPDDGDIVVALVGRMLWDKGIGETIEAARILKQQGVRVRVRLIGAPDPANPNTVPEYILTAANAEGVVDWQGPSTDIIEVWKTSHIAVLPSYGEGMPKSLLEAAAVGRPMIAFDAPGSRDLVNSGENGLLVVFKDANALADAIKTLCEDGALRRRLGQGARKTMEETYSTEKIGAQLRQLVDCILK